MNPVIIGTAGHIDHGKSALVRALTGTDPDRLPEEKSRGITIDLGFAFLSEEIAFIDVPGHEKFIKNMAAGASTVDYALLVVAADDGVMPQTREHLDILELLGVSRGIVAITKADLADAEWLELVKEDVRELVKGGFLENAPVYVVDSISGSGIEEIREGVMKVGRGDGPRRDPGFFRMYIDRVFTVKGYGTVVTGSVLSGEVTKDSDLSLMPPDVDVRVRGIQSHGSQVEQAVAGQRAALNLAGFSKTAIMRGHVLATPGVLKPADVIYADLEVLPGVGKGIKHRQRVHFHTGTAEVLARIHLLEGDVVRSSDSAIVQVRLEEPVALLRGDRFIIRQYSPLVTIGGGGVLDPNPVMKKKKRQEIMRHLRLLASGDGEEAVIAMMGDAGWVAAANLAVRLGMSEEKTGEILEALVRKKEVSVQEGLYAHRAAIESFRADLTERLGRFHESSPLKAGAARSVIASWFHRQYDEASLGLFLSDAVGRGILEEPSSDIFCMSGYAPSLSSDKEDKISRIEGLLKNSGCSVPSPDEISKELRINPVELKTLMEYMADTGRVVYIENHWFHLDVLRSVLVKLRSHLDTEGEVTVSEFRQIADTSRKYAVPLLGWFDTMKRTARAGDRRVAGSLINEDI